MGMSDIVERLRQMTGRHDIEAADTIESLRARLAEANTKLSLCAHHVHGSYDLLNTALLPEAVTDDVLVLSVARGAANLRSRLADYELLKRAVNETGDCLPDCDSHAHNEQCPNVNNHVVLQDKQREIESLRSRLDELREAAGKALRLLDYADVSDDCQYGTISTGTVRELLADLRRLLGEGKP